jgi:hypothetical protein
MAHNFVRPRVLTSSCLCVWDIPSVMRLAQGKRTGQCNSGAYIRPQDSSHRSTYTHIYEVRLPPIAEARRFCQPQKCGLGTSGSAVSETNGSAISETNSNAVPGTSGGAVSGTSARPPRHCAASEALGAR